jgi:hypothetical protein
MSPPPAYPVAGSISTKYRVSQTSRMKGPGGSYNRGENAPAFPGGECFSSGSPGKTVK